MKGPLAAIRGSAELLEHADANDTPPMADADRARFAASIRSQSERLAQMIDKLLALAGVEHRQRLENPEDVPIAELLEAVRESCATRLASDGLVLDVSAATAPATVHGDAFLLRQALVNLVENAADFSPPGARIELVATTTDAGQVRFVVGDRGPGVPDYALPRVFERFYSLPRPEGGSRSSGLGLCFVAEVAALHGGRAALANRDQGGAQASLELPG